MVSDSLARRFLHVNLNCESLAATEALYCDVFGLSARMRGDASVPNDGRILGFDGQTYCATSFLYDCRGGRGGCALEAIEWHTPALQPGSDADPVRPGIRSALFKVGDLGAVAGALRDAGVRVSDPVAGLISGTKSVLAVDADEVVIELAEVPEYAPTALFSGVRISAVDTVTTVKFLTDIGFTVVDPPTVVAVAGEQLSPDGAGIPVDCVLARVALPEDSHQFGITVVQHPDTGSHPLPEGANSQGLYRCALRVENVEKALAVLPDSIEPQGDPVWCPLPGTKIDGLYIAFLRSPDGVVFEFVERPLSFFTR